MGRFIVERFLQIFKCIFTAKNHTAIINLKIFKSLQGFDVDIEADGLNINSSVLTHKSQSPIADDCFRFFAKSIIIVEWNSSLFKFFSDQIDVFLFCFNLLLSINIRVAETEHTPLK